MGNKILVTADSTCDLSPELKERYGIRITPLHVILDGEDRRDGVNVDPDEIYRVYREKKILPKTAAVNVQEYIDFFKPLVEEGYEIIHITLGSALSCCYQNCCLAAEELPQVHPVDSASLSTGSGLMVLEIHDMIEAGQLPRQLCDRHTGCPVQGRPLLRAGDAGSESAADQAVDRGQHGGRKHGRGEEIPRLSGQGSADLC